MCERARMTSSVGKCRNSVTDPEDGREWSVSFEGGDADIVVKKSGASPDREQALAQYERLRQAKADANYRAKAYKDAYARQKETDTPELRESSRSAVEKIVKASDDADKAFREFEKEHPECRLKRFASEEAYWKSKVSSEQKTVDSYAKGLAGWQEKIDSYAGSDDNLKESYAACKQTLDTHQAQLETYLAKAKAVQDEASKVKVDALSDIEILIPVGATVAFS
jgi:chromosome segregation ATPase